MTNIIISKDDAKAQGLRRFFTGIPCRNGHIAQRNIGNQKKHDYCTICRAESAKRTYPKRSSKISAYKKIWRIKNREKIKLVDKDYRENREDKRKRREYRIKWKRENKHRINECRRKRKFLDLAAHKKKNLEYKERNKEKIAKYNAKWAENNHGKRAASWRNRRARIKKAIGKHSSLDIRDIMAKQKSKCAMCFKAISVKPKNGEIKAHVDHIIPIARGGSNWPNNLQCLCWKCNISKGAKDPVEWARENGRLL